MLRIHEVKLNLGEDPATLPDKVRKKLGLPTLVFHSFQISKESIDARDRENIRRVYSLDFSTEKEKELLVRCKKAGLEIAPDVAYQFVEKGPLSLGENRSRPVVVGFGPCGMFAALILAEMGAKPIILERGKPVAERILDVDRFWQEGILDEESNVQFGEGGAGTFSDGKLYTQTRDPRMRKALEELVAAGGDPSLLYRQKAHIGTDVLRTVVINIRNKIIELGGEILFQHKCTGLVIENQQVKALEINGVDRIATESVVMAVGHSARDTFRMLNQAGIYLEQKPFSIGVRVEHPQSMIDATQYGDSALGEVLGAAEYKLSYHCGNGRGVYTFCMCPGGYVVGAASQQGGVVTNGMSYHDRRGRNANSGLLVDVRPEDYDPTGQTDGGSPDPLAGLEFQETYERLAYVAGGSTYRAPAQRLGAFMQNGSDPMEYPVMNTSDGMQELKPTYEPGVTWTDLRECLPDFVYQALQEAIPQFGKKLKGFDRSDAILTGVETRSSSPLRILRDSRMMSNIEGLFPGGEGAGYAGGIISAAVDGIRIAEAIMKR